MFEFRMLEDHPLRFEDAGRQSDSKVLASQKDFPGRGPDFQGPFEPLDDRNVKRPANSKARKAKSSRVKT